MAEADIIGGEVARDAKLHFDHITLLTLTIAWLGVAGGIFLVGAYVVTAWRNPAWEQQVLKHIPAAVGVPSAALGAFIVVAVFRTTEGKILLKVPGFSFEGASGPIIMWALCFAAIVCGIYVLW